jgi:hypothetical protein
VLQLVWKVLQIQLDFVQGTAEQSLAQADGLVMTLVFKVVANC